MGKLGVVPNGPEPIDPLKNKPTAVPLGVVPINEVTAPVQQASQPKVGVVDKVPDVVVSVKAPDTSVPLGPVPPVVTPAPAAQSVPPPVGIVTDETPVYPPPPPQKKPNLGTIRDIAFIPPAPPSEETVGEPVPIVSQPVVIDPFKKDD